MDLCVACNQPINFVSDNYRIHQTFEEKYKVGDIIHKVQTHNWIHLECIEKYGEKVK